MSQPLAPQRDTASFVESVAKTITKNYGPQPIVLERGEGMRVWDRDGNEYLDFVAGIAVSSLGHAHPAMVDALRDQVGRLLHTSNMYINAPMALLQERIVELSCLDRVFFCNSGAEANEAAMKLARRYAKAVRREPDRVEIIAAHKSFHGRTLAAITATGQPKYWKGFEPMPGGYTHVPYNDLAAMRDAIGPQTCAVLLEPVQGEGGIMPADPSYLAGVREACDDAGALLIFDEVQAGVGRLGTLWAYEAFGVEPDIATWAKGIGGGLPLGAMACKEAVADGFQKGSHASTYGGNPVACRAGLVVLEHVSDDAFLAGVRETGAALLAGLRQMAQREENPRPITAVRGMGLMVGAEVGADLAGKIMLACREEGLLINTAGGTVLRFVPPLIATSGDVDEALAKLDRAFDRVATT